MRIADFGLATKTEEGANKYNKCGSPGYVAPEVLREEGYHTRSDIFGLGSILFNLITGRFLFGGRTSDDLILKNYECDLGFLDKIMASYSPQLTNLLK